VCDPRLLHVIEQQLGRAQHVEAGQLEVVPGRPAVGVGLEEVDLGPQHLDRERLLLLVEPLLSFK